MEFESILEGYPVKLANFEGPLDLLLHLIRKHEVNIYDIPIVLVTQQYLDYIDLMQELNLDVAGEFLVMAATLIHIKSRTLLPRTDPDAGRSGRGSARGADPPAARTPEVQGRGGAAARARDAAQRAVDAAGRPDHRDRRRGARAGGRSRSLQPDQRVSRGRRAREAPAEGVPAGRADTDRGSDRAAHDAAVRDRGLRLRGPVRRRADAGRA